MVDDTTFEYAWRTYGASLMRFCRFATGSAETGEDVAAETFARYLQRGSGLPADKVEPWLFTVARNLARSHHRRSNRLALLLPRLWQPDTATPESVETCADMLAPLQPDERLAVYLRVVEDRPFAEVALLVGRSEGATKKLVYRALARLRSAQHLHTPVITPTGGVEHE